jgi:hypothetical protein
MTGNMFVLASKVFALSARVTALLSVVTLPAYVLWCVGAVSILMHGLDAAPMQSAAAATTQDKLLFWRTQLLIQLVGGIYGWFALVALYRRSPIPLAAVPFWIWIGLTIGVIAAVCFGNALVVPPLALRQYSFYFRPLKLTPHESPYSALC